MSRWLIAATVAAAIVATGCGRESGRGRIESLKYEPSANRGPETEARKAFDGAMSLYTRGDYRGAIPGLRRAIDLDVAANDARVYLGVCLLLTGDAKGAVSEFEGLLAIGPAPYLEETYFYWAHGLIETGNGKKAREVLETLIGFGGKYQARAKELLSQIR